MKHYKIPSECPICNNQLTVNGLYCNHCNTKLEGNFTTCKFCRLPQEQLDFLETFIKCRGNIKDVEKELNISYPTVRSRLDELIETLGYKVEHYVDASKIDERRSNILNKVEKGELSATEATLQLKKLK
ncbi:MAG: DUF2089 domain-containing protein [Eubacteriaceae bacterium]